MTGSLYFKAMFSASTFSELKQKPIDLGLQEIMSFEILEKVINFAGSRKITVTRESIEGLILAADFFKMDLLKTTIAEIVRNDYRRLLVNDSNVLSLWRLTLRHDYESTPIANALESYIQCHFEAVMYDLSFTKLDLESVVKILQWDSLNISTERKTFYALKMWVDHDYSHRNQHFVRLLGCMRFDASMDAEFLEENVTSYCTCAASEDFVLQYLELMKEPRLVVGINTQPRLLLPVFELLDSDDDSDTEDDYAEDEYTDDDEYGEEDEYSEMEEDYDIDAYIDRITGQMEDDYLSYYEWPW